VHGRARPVCIAVVLTWALAVCGSSSSTASSTVKAASSLPSGKWGQLISCLQQGHPSFSISAAETGGSVTARADAVVVSNQLSGKELAYVGDLNAGADGVTGTGGMNVDQIAGPVQYGFSPSASTRAQASVTACVQSSGIGVGACSHIQLKGMSCQLAQDVILEYGKAAGTTSSGVTKKTFTVEGQQAQCQELSGTVACQVGSGQVAFNAKS
jgi:hypothetical protein